MDIKFRDYQLDAVKRLRTGSILLGGVGSGKSITGLLYYYTRVAGGVVGKTFRDIGGITKPIDLYIITTAAKRDSLEWNGELAHFMLSPGNENQLDIKVVIDSWNNINKYKDVTGAFFLFDEQHVVGYGPWVKSFIKIAKQNEWILATATPGDTWSDYLPVFIANGFFKNKTHFGREHIVYNTFTNYPKIDRYINTSVLENYKKQILVAMGYESETFKHYIDLPVVYNPDEFYKVRIDRWNIYTDEPIKEGSEAMYTMRRVVNSDHSRLEQICELVTKHSKLIIFYNFDYELEILRQLNDILEFPVAEYNGHIHEDIPQSEHWIYLVQYTAGSEAWNCIETNVVVFYSLNYSYRLMHQAAGRIDRMNTPFKNLYYYYLISDSDVDKRIRAALKDKKDFNEKKYLEENRLNF
jgi:hypothetical protein